MAAPKFPLGTYVYDPSAYNSDNQAYFINQFTTFTNQMGAKPMFMDSFTNYYASWDQWVPQQNALIQGWTSTALLSGVTPVMTIPMASMGEYGNSDAAFKDIIAGKHDDVLLGLINGWKNAGYTKIYARIGPEFNGNYEPWFMGNDAATQADFVLAWRHIADLVHNVSGITVKTIWNPATINYTNLSTADAYPGDQYVDVMGADPYSTVYPVILYDWAKNDGTVDATLQEWFANPVNRIHYWENPNATQYNPNGYDPSQWGMKQAIAFATLHNKPLGLAETGAGGNGTSTGPTDDPDFVKWLYDTLSKPGAPAVEFVNIWDISPPDGNWEFTNGSKPLELAAWQKYFGNPDNVTPVPSAPVPPTIGTGPTTLVLNIAEDAYNGDAQFTVSVDGVQQGGVLTAQGVRGISQNQDFTFKGSWDPAGSHIVSVTFLNDAYGTVATQDRNLYVNSLTVNGATTALNIEEGGNGTRDFAFGAASTSIRFIDSNKAQFYTPLKPLTPASFQAYQTGLNNNISESVDGTTTVLSASGFSMIYTASLVDGSGKSYRLNNFNDTDVSLANGPTAAGAFSTLSLSNGMGGTIAIGSGNYAVDINVLSAYAEQTSNTYRVTFGAGTDSLVLNGDAYRTFAQVQAGAGTDTITLSNVYNTLVTGGAGTSTVRLANGTSTATAGSGSMDVTGGTTADIYVYRSGAGLLTLENFQQSKGDVLEVDQALKAAFTATQVTGGTMLSFGTAGKGVLLKGITSFVASQVAWLQADGTVTTPTLAPPPSTVPVPPTIGSGPDTLVLGIAEDAYQGDAQFTVSVDGVQQGGVLTAQAYQSAGQVQAFKFLGTWSPSNTHSLVVNFLNDAWGGSLALDRNLYVNTIGIDGTTTTVNSAQGLSGTKTYSFGTGPVPAPPAPPVIGTGPNKLVLNIAEQAFQGDAQFTVAVDGVQLGGTFVAQASKAAGQAQAFTFLGTWNAANSHSVTVNFLNDGWGGSDALDRNLYVNSLAIDGAVTTLNATQGLSGPASYSFGTGPTPAATVVGSGSDTLSLRMSEDAYQGDAQFTVAVDGRQVGGVLTATALHGSGKTTNFDIKGDWNTGSHTAVVTFLNDAWGGSDATDRNLYIDSANYDGATVSAATMKLGLTGPQNFSFIDSTAAAVPPGSTTTVGTGADQLVLKLSEDAFQGDAQYTVSVDGTQVGGVFTASSLHNSGVSDTLTVLGRWTAGTHKATVNFLNDAWGGSPATDRNLYVDSVAINGTLATTKATVLATPGAVDFMFPGHA